MDAPRDLVVKVKYGNALRRFTVNIRGPNVDYGVNKLRAKINDLFEINPNVSYSLTYTDEDGDSVTLVNDEEFHDAIVGQRLNPLRINVQLTSDPSTTPSRTPTPQLGNTVNEALKSVPDPLRSVLSRISEEFASKAVETAPAFAEIVEYFSKLGNASKNTDSVGASSERTDSQMNLKGRGMDKLSSLKESFVSALLTGMEDLPEISGGQAGGSQPLPVRGQQSKDLPVTYPLIDGMDRLPKISVDQSGGQPSKDLPVTYPTIASMEELPKTLGGQTNGSQPMPVFGQPSQDLPDDVSKDEVKVAPSVPQVGFFPQTGLHVPSDPWQALRQCDGAFRTFHRGVRCDGCGMHPIMGPRFKSNVKEDYDLCCTCFSAMGNEAEYTRIDRALYRPPRFHHHRGHGFPSCRGPGFKLPRGKLDSRFIQDVTILDGTPMGPLTSFTKIWRMRNNGNVEWPAGTQLLWIGGDRFSDSVSSLLEISESGHPAGCEIDIAVDFKAPPRPGRYISYWRMASPFGQKFGQRVWVLIQVDDSLPTSEGGIAQQELKLDMPPTCQEPHSSSRAINAVINTNPPEISAPELVELANPSSENLLTQPSAPPPALLGANAASMPPAEAPIGETSIGENSIEQNLLKELEEMGFMQTELNREVLRANDYDLEKSINDICGVSEWDPILEELQEMGFCDKEKNKKLLVKNGGSIKRVVLDLIASENADLFV